LVEAGFEIGLLGWEGGQAKDCIMVKAAAIVLLCCYEYLNEREAKTEALKTNEPKMNPGRRQPSPFE
jgi:hypothetical protein